MRTSEAGSRWVHIAGAATTQVKVGRGRLRRLVFNKPVASATVKVIDNTTGTTANMGTVTNTTDVKPYVLEYNAIFFDGLRIVTSGADDITVVYD